MYVAEMQNYRYKQTPHTEIQNCVMLSVNNPVMQSFDLSFSLSVEKTYLPTDVAGTIISRSKDVEKMQRQL